MQKTEGGRRKVEGGGRARIGLCALIVLGTTNLALADGGTLRFSQRRGEFQVSVFTSPSTPSVGPIDVSVLVQDAATGKIRDDVPVIVRLQSIDLHALALEQPATAGAATNKLFRAAVLDVPDPGQWRAEILIGGPSLAVPIRDGNSATLTFDFEVAEPAAHWLSLAPWVGWPIGIIVLFLGHQVVVANSARKNSSRPANHGLPKLR
jgi:hypothetical protein